MNKDNNNTKFYTNDELKEGLDAQNWVKMNLETQHNMYRALWAKYNEKNNELEALKQAVQQLTKEKEDKQKLDLYFTQILSKMESDTKQTKKEEKSLKEQQKIIKFETNCYEDEDVEKREIYGAMNPKIRKQLMLLRRENKLLNSKRQRIENDSSSEEEIILKKKEIKPMSEEQIKKIQQSTLTHLEKEFQEEPIEPEEEEEISEDKQYKKQQKEKIHNFLEQFWGGKFKEPTKEEKEKKIKMEMTEKIRKELNKESDDDSYERFKHDDDGTLVMRTPKREYFPSPIKYTEADDIKYEKYKDQYKELHPHVPKDENENIYMRTIKKEEQIIEQIAKMNQQESELKFKEGSMLQQLVQKGSLSKEFEELLKSKEHKHQVRKVLLDGATREKILQNNLADKDIKEVRDWFLSQGSQEIFDINKLKKTFEQSIGKRRLTQIISYLEKEQELSIKKTRVIINKEKIIQNHMCYKNQKEENLYIGEYKKEEKEAKEEGPK